MSKEGASLDLAFRLRNALVSGYEPAPAASITRQANYPWLVVGTTCISAFMGQVDASIVQLALPTLEQVFHARLGAVSWVAIGYMVAFASALPLFARCAEIVGRKLLYLIGFVLFTLASLFCGLSSDLTHLITYRVLQGIGGAMLGANSIVIMVKAAGPTRQGRAMGIFASAQAIGVSVGPVVGGVLLSALGWRWVFWANVPFGLVGIIMAWLVLPKTSDLGSDKRFDWLGAILIIPALTLLLIALSEGHAWGLTSPAVISCASVAMLLLALFIWQEHKVPAPLIDPHLFRIPAFSGGAVAVILSYALLYAMFFLMSFAFVRGYHDAPLAAGLRLAIIPVALGAVAPLSGALYERLGPRTLTVTGMLVCLAAMVLLSKALTDGSSAIASVMVALAMFGVGLGIFIAPNNSSTMRAAPIARSGEAGGLLNLTRVTGTSIGVATASSVLAWRLAVLAGSEGRTLGVSASVLREASSDVLWVLATFAVIAGIASSLRTQRMP